MNLAQTVPLLFRLALRNLWLFRLRTAIIGGLLAFGGFLAVVGLSLLRDVEFSMRESITGSIVGDIQIYSNKAKDDLAVFGGGFMGRSDVGTLPDLAPVREVAMQSPNVAAVIPMGLDMVFLGRGNELDDTLDSLRDALKSGDSVIITDRITKLRFQLAQLKLEIIEQRKLVADQQELDGQSAAIEIADAPGYLESLQLAEGGDETKLQFLETKIAPISGEKQPIYLNYVGTDVKIFQENFPKFAIVEGQTLPPSHRGILISKKFREDMLKNLVARLFDKLNKRLTKNGTVIAGDAENLRTAADLVRQYSQVMANLDRAAAEELSAELKQFGIAGSGDSLIPILTSQLTDFLTVDDANFKERFAWFYKHIAPRIKLYEISPGETITLRSYTRTGYIKSVPLKVYGIYTFAGLEDSDLAGAMNIIDLVSFRELYGQMTEESRKELDSMRAQVGLREVSAENAIEDLFGGNTPVETAPDAQLLQESSEVGGPVKVKPTIPDRFADSEVLSGLALNAAVRLKDPGKLQETMKDLSERFKAKDFDLRVIDWQTAAGVAGQFVVMVRIALIFSLIIIFIVALVIINNSIVVGTLNRTREIGTMRAIGAQREFVVGLFLAETGITGLIGGFVGAIGAATALGILSAKGIPAPNDIVTFLFSGPRLYPMVRWPMVAAAPIFVTAIATLASIYAARHAAKVTPAEAMQEKE